MAIRTDALGAHALVQEGAQLVDVLPRSIYEQEHLPGAVSLPLESLDRDTAFAALDPRATTVVYCFDQH
jgi:rhodanese-related sulfurtransferase